MLTFATVTGGRGGCPPPASRLPRCRWWCRGPCRGSPWTWPGSGSPELASDELVRALRPLVTGYRAWLDAQQARLADDAEVARYAPAGEQALDRARAVADRLDRAIDLLRSRRDRPGGVPVRQPGHGAATGAQRAGAGTPCRPGRERDRAAAQVRRAVLPELAAVPARVRAAVPAGPDRSRSCRRVSRG